MLEKTANFSMNVLVHERFDSIIEYAVDKRNCEGDVVQEVGERLFSQGTRCDGNDKNDAR
jgi:hypothetical protein